MKDRSQLGGRAEKCVANLDEIILHVLGVLPTVSLGRGAVSVTAHRCTSQATAAVVSS